MFALLCRSWTGALFLFLAMHLGSGQACLGDSLERAKDRLSNALAAHQIWDGPTSGPAAQPGKTVVFVAADLANAGIAGVLSGVQEAAAIIDWKVTVLDAGGRDEARIAALKQAAGLKPDGIILGGFDAVTFAPWIDKETNRGAAVVGWHSAFEPGMVPGTLLFTNVASSARTVALAAASYAVVASGGAPAGVIIFTDTNFSVARAKSDDMAVIIRNCPNCRLLATADVALASAHTDLPPIVQELKSRYGEDWKYSLAINDLYYDVMAEAEVGAGLVNTSAGDGSPSAFGRIRAGSGQAATVAEPLNLQGWQLIDELNRAFAGEGPSGYVPPAHLVVRDNVDAAGGSQDRFDPESGYRDAYRKIWQK
jgi:ribose transport system substrate-binding protein